MKEEEGHYICQYCGKEHIPNEETIAAIEEAENGGGKSFSTFEEMLKELHSDND